MSSQVFPETDGEYKRFKIEGGAFIECAIRKKNNNKLIFIY